MRLHHEQRSAEEKAKEKQREGGGAVPQISAKPPIDTRQEIAKIAGVSRDTISRVEAIEKTAPIEIKERIKQGDLTINKAYNYIKRQEIKEQAKIIEPPEGKYRIIYADPPWNYDRRQTPKNSEQQTNQQATKDL